MNRDRNIIRDKRITPFFLDYMKYNFLMYYTTEAEEGMSLQEAFECQIILEASEIARESLLFKLKDLLDIPEHVDPGKFR